MKPLRRDSAISDPDLAQAARLLGYAQPLPRSEARKRRVWNALTSAGHGRLGFRLSALHVAFASVLFAAASSAAVGHYYVQQQNAEALASPAEGAVAAAPQRPRTAGDFSAFTRFTVSDCNCACVRVSDSTCCDNPA